MFKRLSISLLVLGLAAFGLGAAAFAWFSDSGSAGVQVTSGTVDLSFRVDFDCDGAGSYDTPFMEFDTTPSVADFSWNDIVPGDTTADCIEVLNVGPNGDLAVFAKHTGFQGDNVLRNATLWQYDSDATPTFTDCVFSSPQNAQYTSGRGCALGTIAPTESFILRVDVQFPDDGDQDALQGLAFNFISTLTGYTG